MRRKPESFECAHPDQIDEAEVVEHFLSVTRSSTTKTGGETWACAWAPDNSYFAWSCGHRLLHLVPWDSKQHKRYCPNDTEGLNGRKYHIIDCAETIWSLAFGKGYSEKEALARNYRLCRFDKDLVVATGLASGKIKLWSSYKGTLLIELLDHRDAIRCLDFSNDGSLQLVSASRDGSLKLWDLHNEGNMYHTFKAHAKMILGCKFSPNGKFVAGVGAPRNVYLWPLPVTSSLLFKLEGHCNEVVSVDFSPDSALMATASYDTKVIIWDTWTKEKFRVLGHLHPSPHLIFAGGANDHYVRSVNFSISGLTLATVCDDGFVRFWNLAMQGDPVLVATIAEAVSSQFSPDGGVLAVGCRNGDVVFVSAPSPVPSLTQLCRLVIRKPTSLKDVECLPLPKTFRNYLQYQDFFPITPV